MATIREILVEWTTPAGGGHRSVTYWESGISVASQRLALGTWLNQWKLLCSTSTAYGVAISGREIDDATGLLVGSWSDSPLHSSNGTGSGQPVADATQALVRWKTSTIVNGRFLQGHTFLPGMVVGNLSSGNMLPAAMTTMQTASNTLIASATGLVVWHRPGPAGPGSHTAVSTASVSSELAVLRRRR